MYERILVAPDGSDLAEQVLPYVRLVAGALGSRIDLLRVLGPLPAEMDEPARRHYRERADDDLSGVRTALEAAGLTATASTQEGRPADSIVVEAEREPGTLIAMSTHGRSGLSRWMVGSVTDKVLHASRNPLLIVRAREGHALPEARLKTMIVPLDGSSLATEILSFLVPLIKALGLGVVLVRAVRPLTGPTEADPLVMTDFDDGDWPDAMAAEYLQEVVGWFAEQRVEVAATHVLREHPASAIVGLARETPDSLVAMSTHGRSGVSRSVLGSVTDRVVQQSGDPVLVIRAE
jgi:nucleotide-binding universal stress UspA family protein